MNVKLQGAPTAQMNELGELKKGAAVPVTVKINPVSCANCPSGLMTLTILVPGVDPTVDTVTVSVVGLTTVTAVTVTPGISTPIRLIKPGPGSKNPEPPTEVPVSVKVVLAVPDGIDEVE